MKRVSLLKHLHLHGCTLHREGGRHTIYKNADGTLKTSVPRHSEIKSGTVRKICKDVNIPPPSKN